MSPLLFNIFLEIVMVFATEYAEEGAIISGHVIGNLRFADDIAVLEESEDGIHRLVSNIHRESTRFGLKINILKTVMQRIACHDEPVKTVIDSTPLKQVNKFLYLGGTISSRGTNEEDVARRIDLAASASRSLTRIWIKKSIKRKTKVRICEVLVTLLLLCNSQTWTLKEKGEIEV